MMKKLVLILATQTSGWRGRGKSPAMTIGEIFFEFLDCPYNKKIEKHKKLYKKIKKHLNLLSSKYNSMYTEDNTLIKKLHVQEVGNRKKKKLTYCKNSEEWDRYVKRLYEREEHFTDNEIVYRFKGKYNSGWSRLGYFIPNLFSVSLSSEMRRMYDWKMTELMIVASFLKSCENEVIFTKQQISRFIGVSFHKFKKMSEELGVYLMVGESELSTSEKFAYETHEKKMARGLYYRKEDVKKINKFIRNTKMNLNFKNIYALRSLIVQNYQRIDKSTIKEVQNSLENDNLKAYKDSKKRTKNEIFELQWKNFIRFHDFKMSAINKTESYPINRKSKSEPKARAFQNKLATAHKKSFTEYNKKQEKLSENKDMCEGTLSHQKPNKTPVLFRKEDTGWIKKEFTAKMKEKKGAIRSSEEIFSVTRSIWKKLCEKIGTVRHYQEFSKSIKDSLESCSTYKISNVIKKRVYKRLEKETKSVPEVMSSPVFFKDFADYVAIEEENLLKIIFWQKEHILQKSKDVSSMSKLSFDSCKRKLKECKPESESNLKKRISSLFGNEILSEKQEKELSYLRKRKRHDLSQTSSGNAIREMISKKNNSEREVSGLSKKNRDRFFNSPDFSKSKNDQKCINNLHNRL